MTVYIYTIMYILSPVFLLTFSCLYFIAFKIYKNDKTDNCFVIYIIYKLGRNMYLKWVDFPRVQCSVAQDRYLNTRPMANLF